MKLDNFVQFGRTPSDKVIIQVMAEFVVSYNQITGQQYQNHLESKAMCLFIFTTKYRMCTYFKIHLIDSTLNMPCVDVFVKHTLCSLY